MNIVKKFKTVLTMFLSSSFANFSCPFGMVALKKQINRLKIHHKGIEMELRKKGVIN